MNSDQLLDIAQRAMYLSERNDPAHQTRVGSQEYLEALQKRLGSEKALNLLMKLEGIDREEMLGLCGEYKLDELPPWTQQLQEIMSRRWRREDIDRLDLQAKGFPRFLTAPLKLFALYAIEHIDYLRTRHDLALQVASILWSSISTICVDPLICLSGGPFGDASTRKPNADTCVNEEIEQLFLAFPVTARLVTEKTMRFIENMNVLFLRVQTDWADLENEFGCYGEVTGIKGNIGDSHNGAQSVLILTFSSGTKVVYKPRSLAIDNAYKDYLKVLDIRVKTPRVIIRDGYGWAECIQYSPSDDCRPFFFHIGEIMFSVYLSGGCDIHSENVIVYKDSPVVIDCETVFSSLVQGSELGYSVKTTSMLHAYMKMGGCIFEDKGLLTQFKSGDIHLPDGVLGSEFQDDICAGFESTYLRTMRIPSEELAGTCPDDVRFLMRHTKNYAFTYQQMLESENLRDGRLYEIAGDRLFLACVDNESFFPIFKSERASLIAGDIPYFYIKGDTKDLYTRGSLIERDYFQCTVSDNLGTRKSHLSESDLKGQLATIREELGETPEMFESFDDYLIEKVKSKHKENPR